MSRSDSDQTSQSRSVQQFQFSKESNSTYRKQVLRWTNMQRFLDLSEPALKYRHTACPRRDYSLLRDHGSERLMSTYCRLLVWCIIELSISHRDSPIFTQTSIESDRWVLHQSLSPMPHGISFSIAVILKTRDKPSLNTVTSPTLFEMPYALF
jgi:hypothetical protein